MCDHLSECVTTKLSPMHHCPYNDRICVAQARRNIEISFELSISIFQNRVFHFLFIITYFTNIYLYIVESSTHFKITISRIQQHMVYYFSKVETAYFSGVCGIHIYMYFVKNKYFCFKRALLIHVSHYVTGFTHAMMGKQKML